MTEFPYWFQLRKIEAVGYSPVARSSSAPPPKLRKRSPSVSVQVPRQWRFASLPAATVQKTPVPFA